MIMLVLIQFDVCGYDLIHAFYMADKVSADFVSTSDTSISDNDDSVSAWSNPVYRGVSPRSLIKAPFVEFSSLTVHIYQRELPFLQRFAHYFLAKLFNLTYLRYCVFRI